MVDQSVHKPMEVVSVRVAECNTGHLYLPHSAIVRLQRIVVAHNVVPSGRGGRAELVSKYLGRSGGALMQISGGPGRS
tara:strand:- start:576 stop:809 length:234 start_codon:yes stop_codon:yes gene_type:complete